MHNPTYWFLRSLTGSKCMSAYHFYVGIFNNISRHDVSLFLVRSTGYPEVTPISVQLVMTFTPSVWNPPHLPHIFRFITDRSAGEPSLSAWLYLGQLCSLSPRRGTSITLSSVKTYNCDCSVPLRKKKTHTPERPSTSLTNTHQPQLCYSSKNTIRLGLVLHNVPGSLNSQIHQPHVSMVQSSSCEVIHPAQQKYHARNSTSLSRHSHI